MTVIKEKVRNKLNIQGMAIKSKLLVGTLEADPGKVFVARDIISAEPMVTYLLTECPYYGYAVYHGLGQKPFWQNNILMIGDLYLMYASVNPITKDKVRELFNADEWIQDPEIVKTKLKKERTLNKLICLASAYGVGVNTLQMHLMSAGFKVSKFQVQEILSEFWALFRKIKRKINELSRRFDDQGYLINLFGYRCVPKSGKDGLNAVNQSSVQGLMNVYMKMIFENNEQIGQEFVTLIHDCLIVQMDEDKVELSNKLEKEVLTELNRELEWSIPVRTDFHSDKTFFGLK